MSREDGFDVADVATGHLDDPKVKALWRALAPDQDRMSRALTLHLSVLLASWRQGFRVTVSEAVPVWLDPDESLVNALTDARLLDKTGRIPSRSWKSWFGPASERRDKTRDRWRRANERRLLSTPRGNSADTARDVGSGTARPVRPSDRTVRPTRAPAREAPSNDGGRNGRVGTLAETMAAMGLKVKS
jgi:hypothetical protein